MRVMRLAVVVAISLCVATTAFASNWTGGDGDWGLGTNWSAGVPDGTDAYIGNGQIVTLDTDEPDITTLDVSWFSTLNIEPGAGLTASGEASVASGGNDTGIVAQSGGVVSLNSNLVVGTAAGSIASWTMTDDGTLGVGADLIVGGDGQGAFELKDTSDLTVTGNVNIGASGGSGTMTVSGGTAILADVNVTVGSFEVNGNTPSINVANYEQASGGVLDIVFDDSGISTINASGDMTLDGTLNVSVSGGTPDGIYDIIAAAGTRTGGFDVINLPAGVEFRYAPDSATAKLYVGVEAPPIVQHSIAVNVTDAGGVNDIGAAELAGFVPETNWNNIVGNNGAYGGTIVRGDGAATGMTWTQTGSDDHSWGAPDVSGMTTPDARLYAAGPVSTTWSWTWATVFWGSYTEIQLTDVLAALGDVASYDVHIYNGTPGDYAGNPARRSETLIGTTGGSADPAFIWSGDNMRGAEPSWAGSFLGLNHYVIEGVTEDDPIITFRHGVWPFHEKTQGDYKPVTLAGIQIIGEFVEVDVPGPVVPEPAGLGLIGLSLLALKKRRR